MNEKNEKTKKMKNQNKKRTFGVKAPSFKVQFTYGKEGRGSTVPKK